MLFLQVFSSGLEKTVRGLVSGQPYSFCVTAFTMVGEGGGRDNDKISKSPFYWHNHAQENQVHHPYHHLSYG